MTGRHRLGLAALAVWAPLTPLVIATFMVDHIAPLPPLGDPCSVRRAVAARWGDSVDVVHVIAARCSCTRGLIAHLVERGESRGRSELVLFVGPPPPGGAAIEGRGFDVEQIAREELRRDFAIDGAPVLVVRDPNGEVAYAGGYFDSPAAVHALDERILAEVQRGGRPDRLPLFGCAVDPALADERDPLGLRGGLEELEAWLVR